MLYATTDVEFCIRIRATIYDGPRTKTKGQQWEASRHKGRSLKDGPSRAQFHLGYFLNFNTIFIKKDSGRKQFLALVSVLYVDFIVRGRGEQAVESVAVAVTANTSLLYGVADCDDNGGNGGT